MRPGARRRTTIACIGLFAILTLTPPSAGPAADELISLDLATRIFLKILLLDRELESKTSNRVIVGVIGSDAAHEAFSALRGQRIDKSRNFVVADVIRYETLGPDSRPPTLLYVGPHATPEEVTPFTRRHGVLSVTTVHDYLDRGVTLGLAIEKGKPRVILNLLNSDHEGLHWNSKMLKISRVVR
ncbi:MAG: YfiR family protein [Deltaproteobacteria bacterium]|nr:YfiR family protein [Deltaproteobacteria bacterium]